MKSFSHSSWERDAGMLHWQKALFLTVPPPENEMLAKQILLPLEESQFEKFRGCLLVLHCIAQKEDY